MTTTLITGASRGLGFETARRLVGLGHTVWLTARDADRGGAAAASLGARFVRLDVTDAVSVRQAAETVERDSGQLDVLVNNAGISGGFVAGDEGTAKRLRTVFQTNVFGVGRVLEAFRPLLDRSPTPVVVNVSSGMGSFGVTTDPARIESGLTGLVYPPSKAALNMLTSQYAKAIPRLRINAVDPGYTTTDFNGFRGTRTVAEGAEVIVRMATVGADGPTGAFLDVDGTVPW